MRHLACRPGLEFPHEGGRDGDVPTTMADREAAAQLSLDEDISDMLARHTKALGQGAVGQTDRWRHAEQGRVMSSEHR